MSTIKIKADNALKAYKNANPENKKFLEDLIGKDQLQLVPADIKERLKSEHDIIDIHGADDDLMFLLNYKGENEVLNGAKAHSLAAMLCNLLNGDWVPDWDNSIEYKWSPFFYLNSPGFRFLGADDVITLSSVGSRLCFKTEADCIWAAKTFPQLYEVLLTKNYK